VATQERAEVVSDGDQVVAFASDDHGSIEQDFAAVDGPVLAKSSKGQQQEAIRVLDGRIALQLRAFF
jgi:hypothetical protein